MSSPAAHRVACAPASQPVFPDEILEEIFLRLDAAEDLARASAACTAFHRVVSARRFLGRFRCLHPTPALGFLEIGGHGAFHPAEPPHRSAPAARALARAADFTFSFLGTPNRWQVCDARDGRGALARAANFTFSFLGTRNRWQVCDARDGRVLLYRQVKVTLMVCDPLHRRQVQLPPIPNDLASASRGFGLREFDSFLDPATDTEKEKQDLSFRVICAVQNQHKVVTLHFSSATGQWRGITFNRPVPLGPFVSFKIFGRYYAHGCFFWRIGDFRSFMVMLNMHDMKLSTVDLPPGIHDNRLQTLAIVEAGEGMIGLFTLSDGMLQLYYKSLQGTEWQHERTIPLPKPDSYWQIHNVAAGHLLLQATRRYSSQFAKRESQCFTLNLKTFLVERLCVLNQRIMGAHLYARFLLPFSKPSI